ncbi:protein scarlet-like [Sitophilus oryzae]|uniref:Protein scarlet-like n=1 Tax=Sitophilus oryzae TaxID=7048 RepID=A0A6J2XCA4_SITOR|nr:protein scarlet-like [Sitophilus oryzae]
MAKFIFTWHNINYSVEERCGSFLNGSKKRKILIDDVSGCAFSGSVIAIIGGSGCGKTALLTLLSGQRKGRGVLKINGRIITGKMLRSNSTYLQQSDVFFENLTVEEHITFKAAMSLNKTKTERELIISLLLKNLSLGHLTYVKIKNLSSGEKRRLSLLSCLFSDPYILFCDEPISGLDSFSATTIVKILIEVASSGKIVFMTVHQPSSEVFELFNNIIMLSPNGKIVFEGSKDNAKTFFESQLLFCPSSYNPADFYLNHIIIKTPNDERKIEDLVKQFKEDYSLKFDFPENGYHGLLLKYKEKENGFLHELKWLSWRVFVNLGRNTEEHYFSFILTVITASILGIVYSNVTLAETSAVQSIQGVLLLIVSELIFIQMYQAIYTFPEEVNIFVQEKELYSPLPYFLSKTVSLIPFALVHSLVFLIIYFTCLPFLTTSKLLLEMYLILFLTSVCGSSLGLCLSALFPTLEYINLFIVPFEILCLVLSGLWIRIHTLSKAFSIVKYISPFYVTYESICIVYWLDVGHITNCSEIDTTTCFENGTDVLGNYDFGQTYERVSNNLIFLIILIIAYCYIGYIGILRKRALYHI